MYDFFTRYKWKFNINNVSIVKFWSKCFRTYVSVWTLYHFSGCLEATSSNLMSKEEGLKMKVGTFFMRSFLPCIKLYSVLKTDSTFRCKLLFVYFYKKLSWNKIDCGRIFPFPLEIFLRETFNQNITFKNLKQVKKFFIKFLVYNVPEGWKLIYLIFYWF